MYTAVQFKHLFQLFTILRLQKGRKKPIYSTWALGHCRHHSIQKIRSERCFEDQLVQR